MTITFPLNKTRKITLLSDIQDFWENESKYDDGVYWSCDCEDEKGGLMRLNMSSALMKEIDDLHSRLIQEGKKGIDKGSVLEIKKKKIEGTETSLDGYIAWFVKKIN